MKLTDTPFDSSNIFSSKEEKAIFVQHRGKELMFFAGAWGKIDNAGLVYNDINAYWDSLPTSRQDSIWAIYEDIHELLSTVSHFGRLHSQVRQKVAELLAQHPFDEIKYYVDRYSSVKYPNDLKDNYGSGAPEGELTYLRMEYEDLIALIVQLRPMIPVWGEYIDRCKSELGTQHKDHQAGLLLAQSHVPKTAPYQRLLSYITAYLGETGPMLEANLAGISSANFPNWLMNVTLVKRLVITELVTTRMTEEATNVMSKIYNHIRAASEKPDKFHRGVLKDKSTSNVDMGNEEDNTSRIELVKVREPISEGQIVSIEHYVEQTIQLAKSIDATIPNSLVNACLNFMGTEGRYKTDDFRFWLATWTLCGIRLTKQKDGSLVRKRELSPKALPLLRHESQLSAMAAAQALLWHWGFHELAVLITDAAVQLDANTMVGSTINKLNKHLVTHLVDLYPMPQVTKGKKADRHNSWPNPNEAALKLQAQKHCIAIKEIDQFVKTVGSLAWKREAPAELLKVSSYQVKGSYNMLVSDIRNQLATLILTSKVPELNLRHSAEPHWYRDL